MGETKDNQKIRKSQKYQKQSEKRLWSQSMHEVILVHFIRC